MKRYIKPNTEIHSVELQSMIANTIQVTLNTTADPITNTTTGWQDLGKETEITSTSLWDAEE